MQDAFKIQEKLRKKIVLGNRDISIEIFASVDVGFFNDTAIAAVCVFGCSRFRLGPLLEVEIAKDKISFPYIPGLLTFREGPVILKAFSKVKNRPDVILFDGQGICHPRRMGIATHMGIILNTPSIGCAKSPLYGIYRVPNREKGAFSYIYDKDTHEILGAALRTRTNVKPIFVSPGYKISLKQSIDLVLKLCPKYKIPEPLRYAHKEASL